MDELGYLKSIRAQLVQIKTGALFSRHRALLGNLTLEDNVNWLDNKIEQLEKEWACRFRGTRTIMLE